MTGARLARQRIVERTFSSLRIRNFRLYFLGQIVSVTGMWIQFVGLTWLTLQLTDSGVALGVTTALQWGPLLVGGAWAGVVVDRVDKRRLIIAGQVGGAIVAAVLAVLAHADLVSLPVIYGLSFALGCIQMFDNPARRAFIVEMVGTEHVANAVALNSALMTISRVVGPAVGGVLVATVAIAICFDVNAVSFIAIIVGLVAMRPAELVARPRAERAPGQLREGVAYASRTPDIRLALIIVTVMSVIGVNYEVILPLLAKRSFDGGSATYGLLLAILSVGSVAGAMRVASRNRSTVRAVVVGAIFFGAALVVAGLAPNLAVEAVVLLLVGVMDATVTSGANALLQIVSVPELRGRVMALYSVVFLGTNAIGAIVTGTLAELIGPRRTLAIGGAAVAVVTLVASGSGRTVRNDVGEPAASLEAR